FDVEPFGRFDLTAFGFVITALIIVWGVLRVRLLDIVPVARGVGLGTLVDAVLVLDAFDRVADLNPAGERVIQSTVATAIGHPVDRVLPELAVILDGSPRTRPINVELRLDAEAGFSDYEVTVTSLPDQGGRPSGRLVVLRDISERKLAEERLE